MDPFVPNGTVRFSLVMCNPMQELCMHPGVFTGVSFPSLTRVTVHALSLEHGLIPKTYRAISDRIAALANRPVCALPFMKP